MNNIGIKVRETRKLKAITQENLADLSGINLRTIQRIENNETEPRFSTLKRICKVLELNIEDLSDFGKVKNFKTLAILHISVLSFIVLPFGNIIIPLLLWITNRNNIIGLDNIGKNILNYQILWSIISFILTLLYVININNLSSNGNRVFIVVILSFICLNIFFPIYFGFKTSKENLKLHYPNIFKFIK